MDEAYPATDIQLSRDVAITVLSRLRHGILGMTLILFLTALGLAQGPWRNIGPEDRTASVSDLAIDPTNPMMLYAGTSGDGVFRSTDRGANWSRINKGLPVRSNIRALAIHPTNPVTLYAGPWRSDPTQLECPQRLTLYAGADPMTLYAGTDGGGVSKRPMEAPAGVPSTTA